MAKERRSEAIWVDARERWQINVQRDGKRKTFTSSIPGRRGKHDAEEKADEWLDAGQPEDMRFDAAWALYLDHVRRNTGTANARDIECIGRNWLLDTNEKRRLSSKRLSRIHLKDLQDIISDAGEMGRSKRTCKNIKDKLSGFFRFAKDHGWGYSVDPQRIKLPTQARAASRNVIQPDKLRVLFSDPVITRHGIPVTAPYIHAFRLLVVIGCRSGELCGLTSNDYDGTYLTIRRSINKYYEATPGKTENAQRKILLPERAKAILADQAAMLHDMGIRSDYLFPRTDGSFSAPPDLSNHWRTYSSQHGIDCSIHELRHTFVSMMNTNLPSALLKDIIGHSAAMDTDGVYGHEIDGDKQRAAQIIDAVFARHLQD